MLKVAKIEPQKVRKFSAREGHFNCWLTMEINEPEGVASYEEFRPGEEVGDWHYWYDEIFHFISGRAECHWTNPPSFNEWQKRIIEGGDLLLIKKGMTVKWKVLGDEPLKFVFIAMPRPEHFDL